MKQMEQVTQFFSDVDYPFVVVSTLPKNERQAVIDFLLKLEVPVYLEAISGIREEPSLKNLRILNIDFLWHASSKHGYPIDGFLRIGGVPTLRPWRDLEYEKKEIPVCSVSTLPFSGTSRGGLVEVSSMSELMDLSLPQKDYFSKAKDWLEVDRGVREFLFAKMTEEPASEPSLISQLSRSIPENSLVYLGNSLPIREWDLTASYLNKQLDVYASRGLNGIDGQISTFLGMAQPDRSNWGIFGDLTMLYDLAAPWVLEQLIDISVNIVVVNNHGGKIFARKFTDTSFQNCHSYDFEHIARHWKMEYCKWERIPSDISFQQSRLIELVPNPVSTERFWEKYQELKGYSVPVKKGVLHA